MSSGFYRADGSDIFVATSNRKNLHFPVGYGNVNGDGTLTVYGSNSTGSTRSSTGVYVISFPSGVMGTQNAMSCTRVGGGAGFISTQYGGPTYFYVFTYDINGNAADSAFNFVLHVVPGT